eukprot:scaffold14.g1099.t1
MLLSEALGTVLPQAQAGGSVVPVSSPGAQQQLASTAVRAWSSSRPQQRQSFSSAAVAEQRQDPHVMAELHERVGIASLSEVLHSEFRVNAANAAAGRIQFPHAAGFADWAAYRSSAELLDRLVGGRGGLAALMGKVPGSCMVAIFTRASSLEQRLEWLQGREPPGAQQAGRQPLLALSEEQLERLAWKAPNALHLPIETMRAKATLLHEVLGVNTEEVSKIISSTSYLALNLADRRELLEWLAKELYRSQQAARTAVVKTPALIESQVATCQQSVAALRRRLAGGQQLSKDQLDAKVLRVCTRQPAALAYNIDGPLMAAKLNVFADAGYSGSVALGEHFQYLTYALPRLAVRLTFVAARAQLPVKLGLVTRPTAERLCKFHSLSHEAFLAYERSYFDSPDWVELCKRHGLGRDGQAPSKPRSKQQR